MKLTIICTMIIATSLNTSAGLFDKVSKALDSGSDKKKTEAPKKSLTIEEPKRTYSYNSSDMSDTKRMLTAFEPFYLRSVFSDEVSESKTISVGSSLVVTIPDDEKVKRILDEGYAIVTDKHVYLYYGAGLSMSRHSFESIIAMVLGNDANSRHREMIESVKNAKEKFSPQWKELLEKERSGIIAFKPGDVQWGDSIDVLTFNGFTTANGFQRDADREYYFGINRNTKGYGDPNAGVYRLKFQFGFNEIDEAEAVKNYTSLFGEPKFEENHQFNIYTWNKDGIKTTAKFTKHGTFMTEINQYSNKHNALHEEFLAQGKAKENEARKNATGSALGF